MVNDIDLSHIDKQIQDNQANAAEARKQANNQRVVADQKRRAGDVTNAGYYEQEAVRFDQKALAFENENNDLQASRQSTQAHITELEAERNQINTDNAARLTAIDQELTRLRGTSGML